MQTRDEEKHPIVDSSLHIKEADVVDSSLTSRLGFIRKVYSILSLQLLFTALLTIWCITQEPVKNFVVQQIILFVLAAITAIVLMCVLLCCKANARKAPKNYILLSLFTFCEAYVVAFICCSTATENSNGIEIIVIALSMTVLMTMGLTLYACTTKEDFTICTGLLWSLAICLIMLFIFSLIYPSRLLSIIYSIFAIFLYSIYIIVDTQLIVGSKRHSLQKDDYIIGALILYIDIIILFLELVKLIAQLTGKH
ncbi:unnamed protein product (macronuclear) [Paramecium tetraurelia]|uniref:Uncharacterized protein n=1 Tax=Paramecium tetraurelia TaxID=5888 RepID=A0BPQ8_PARTE|nr:uncharacterized protein GSPATT00005275001 [Paramecium tetraurelia]CAK60525.1 unnamed protein product [Paramecium tetraurelia]|eukprot:XP_001427923.1 hypothetical protein (macronuclear) [Paramecium tetraurelia strain d4-2]